MTPQAPSVGRIVHYVSYGTPGGEYASECRAAVVTAVDQGVGSVIKPTVSLAVLNPTGMFFNESVVQDEGGTSDTPGAPTVRSHRGGTWHWPERV